MNPFSRMWEWKGGGQVVPPISTAYHDGTVSRGELHGLRRLFRMIFREPVETIPATGFTLGPTTNDFKPGFAVRREKRVLAEEAAKQAAAASADGARVFIRAYGEHELNPR